MAIAIALDDDLVGIAPQHRASAPALVAVDLIAKAHGKFAEIDLPFEGVEFAILIPHRKTPFPSLLPVFFLGDHWLSAAVAVASLVRQLRGPHFSTCPSYSRRANLAVTAAALPSSSPQSP